MPARMQEQKLRERVAAICGALPEVTWVDGRQHIKFEVRGKSFAYFLNDHHGDGRIAINVKGAPGQPQSLVAAYPKRFFIPPYLGPRGWLGLYIDSGKVDWGEVEMLITDSYRMTAPKRLVARLGG